MPLLGPSLIRENSDHTANPTNVKDLLMPDQQLSAAIFAGNFKPLVDKLHKDISAVVVEVFDGIVNLILLD